MTVPPLTTTRSRHAAWRAPAPLVVPLTAAAMVATALAVSAPSRAAEADLVTADANAEAALVAAEAPAATQATPVIEDREFVLTHGHVDGFDTTYDAATGELVLTVKDDTRIHSGQTLFHAPETTTFAYEDDRAVQTLPPANGPWEFLGDHGGTEAWIATQTGGDQEYVPWVGWSTERLTASLAGTGIEPAAGRPVELEVVVDGPGDVFTFQNDSFGQPINQYLDTTTSDGGTIPVAANAHVHTNWVFTAAGDYTLEVTPRLDTVGSGTITGPTANYHVRVGERVEPDPEPTPSPSPSGTPTPGPTPGPTPDPTPSGTPSARPTPDPTPDPTASNRPTPDPTKKPTPKPTPSGDPGRTPPPSPTPTTPPAGGPDRPGNPAGGPDRTPGPSTPAEPQCLPYEVEREVTTKVPAGGITDGHLDFGAMVSGDKLQARVKDDREQPASWVDPASVTFRLGDAAEREIPASGDFSALGTAGDAIWSIGQTQEDGVPWLGWNTQHPTLLAKAAGPVTFTLDGVTGPGRLGVYANGTFGGIGTKYFGNLAGFPETMSVPLNQHVHGNWVFTEPGAYTVTITQSVELEGGAKVSDTASLKFSVGDATSTSTEKVWVGRTADGKECELSQDEIDRIEAAGGTYQRPGGPLASTGADVATMLTAAATATALGALLLVLSRRRRLALAGGDA